MGIKPAVRKLVTSGVKTGMPGKVSPMLCTLASGVVKDPQFVHEIKFDGYRIIAHVNKSNIRLNSRSGLDYTSKYPSVRSALFKIRHDMILDGEVCVLNEEGLPDFETLQSPGLNSHLVYYVFDILWLNGFDLMGLTLLERKMILHNLLGGNPIIRYSEHFDNGADLYKKMEGLGMEGIVSKKKDSEYIPGNRGSSWLKTTTEKRQEFVIGGWVESDKRHFRTLLFGAFKGKELVWVGHSGGGFKHKEMPVILKKLQSIETKDNPFSNKVEYKGVIHWAKPKLVANFKYSGFTKHGRIRKPATFLGFRTDKNPSDVVIEIPKKVPVKASRQTNNTKVEPAQKRKYLNQGSGWEKVDKVAHSHKETLEFDNCSIDIYDVDREIWKGIHKADLIQYYHSIARYILPHLKDRPQSLLLKLNGIHGPRIFIKDMENRQPSCAIIFDDKRRVRKEGKRNRIDYLVCNNVETLLYMINLGCVDINPWASRRQSPDDPDYIWLDLDPTIEESNSYSNSSKEEKKGFTKAIKTAQATKKILDRHRLKAFPKTSGKTGIHIYIPCTGFTFSETRLLAGKIADEVHHLLPAITTRNESISLRGLKLYIDAGQNDYADTLAAPYSVRPHHQPTVSAPLSWSEIGPALRPGQFTMHNIIARLNKKGDLFEGTLDKKVALANSKILKRWLK
jgi:bifunctional non-homologous end joining protein LigD